MSNIVHVIGTGTIGEPLIGLLDDHREAFGIDEITFHKRTPLIAEFEDLESVERWGDQPDHKLAQAAGKDHVYDRYDVAVCEVVERHTSPVRGDRI